MTSHPAEIQPAASAGGASAARGTVPLFRVLVVDDDPLVRGAISACLRHSGYVVHEASDGRKALTFLSHRSVELVIADILMPDLDGIELVMRLADRFPDIKILAISGEGQFGPGPFLTMAGHLGAHRTLAKPFEPAQLVGMVEEIIGRAVAK
ncbi:MAG: response regulator [Opitutaceae bacterium]|nr:response regulator [Opitutaceae bacterium]